MDSSDKDRQGKAGEEIEMEIKINRYRARPGRGFGHERAERYGKELEALHARSGKLSASIVVEAASDEASPLHDAFTWADDEAARLHREHEARRLMAGIEVEIVVDGRVIESRAFVSIFDEGAPGADPDIDLVTARRNGARHPGLKNDYAPIKKVVERPELLAQYREQARGELERWIKRYQNVQGLEEMVAKARAALAAAAA